MRGQLVAVVVAIACGACGSAGPPPATTAGAAATGSADDADGGAAPPTPTRRERVAPAELDDSVAPVAARLALDLDPAAPGYRGTIELELDVARATDVIWFHAAPELTLVTASATRGGQPVAIDVIIPASADMIAGVSLHAPLAPGPLTLRLELAADYRQRDGIFVQGPDGQRVVYTDFEPIDARRAFPCFDLPHWRVPWTITVRAPDGLGAYANTAALQTTREGDWIAHQFAPTPPLPTYLVAVAVGDLAIVEVPAAPIPTRLLVPKPAGDVRLAASLLGPILDAARATIDRPIPWAKLDVVLVPEFSGAMENPGLVTIASDLTIAPRSADGRRLLAMILAHEVAHLWFGDWVTLSSWRELWLNEGLASWMADQTLVALTPPWRDPVARADDRVEVYVDDSVATAHALRPDRIAHPRALFDRLSYDKGAAVIHTLGAWLGPARVRAALAGHLDRHAWGAASSDELIAALAAIDPQQPIAGVITDAIGTVGVPTVVAEVACNADEAHLGLRAVPATRRLAVCARWGGPDAGRGCAVIDGAATLPLGRRCPTWIVPDADALGYHHWQLPARWWSALAAAPLAPAELRLAIEEVMRGLAAGDASTADATAILAAAIATGDHQLIEPAARWAHVLAAAVPDRDRAALARAIGAATDRALARLGRAPVAHDDPDRARARLAALELAGVLAGDPRVVRWADKTVAAWLRGAHLADATAAAAIVVVGHRGKAKRKRALAAAAHRDVVPGSPVARALGRALATSPDGAVARLLDVTAEPALPVAVVEGLLGALLADPRRAAATGDLLRGRDAYLALFATTAPCHVAPAPAGGPPEAPFVRERLRPRLALAAAACRAVVDRLAAP